MFVGHCAAGFIAKGIEPRASMALLFIVALFLDFALFAFALMDIETLTIQKDATASTHFLLENMPWSHSILAALVWSVFLLVIADQYFKVSRTTTVILIMVSLSHWVLDWIVHDSDLVIWPFFQDSGVKLGLGLWNNAIGTYLLECGILIAAFYYYIKRTHAISQLGKYGPIVFVISLVTIQTNMIFGAYVQMSTQVFALIGLASLLAFVLIAGFLDSHRRGGGSQHAPPIAPI